VVPWAPPRPWRSQYLSESVEGWTIRIVWSVGSFWSIARFYRITEIAFLCRLRDVLPLCQIPDPDPMTLKRWPSLAPNEAVSRLPSGNTPIQSLKPCFFWLPVLPGLVWRPRETRGSKNPKNGQKSRKNRRNGGRSERGRGGPGARPRP
jgi:hypothetical protein